MPAAPVKLDQWFCQISGKVLGPYSTQELKRLVREERLLPTDGVKKGRDGKWVAAQNVKNLFTSKTRPVEEDEDQDEASAGKSRVMLFTACGIGGVLLLISMVCVIIAANRRGATPDVAPKPSIAPDDSFALVEK